MTLTNPADTTAEAFFDHCDFLLGDGKHQEALDHLILGLERFQEQVPERARLAEYLSRMGQYDAAIDALSYLLSHESFHVRLAGKIDTAAILSKKGEHDAADTMMWEAHRSEPSNPWPVRHLLTSAARTGDMHAIDLIAAQFSASAKPESAMEVHFAALGTKAKLAFETETRGPGWTPLPIKTVPALAQAGLVTMVKNEADIFGQMLQHHYDLGIRSYCILDNRSEDRTADIVSEFRDNHPDALVIYVFDPVIKHYQADKLATFAASLVSMAKLEGRTIDWIFYMDGDEFIAPVSLGACDRDPFETFDQVLRTSRYQVLVFHWIHGATSTVLEETPETPNVFEAFPNLERTLPSLVTKVALRPELRPTQGNHAMAGLVPPYGALSGMGQIGWFIFHFPMRSLAQYRSKVINGVKAYENAPDLEGYTTHWKAYYRQFQEHGDGVFHNIVANYVRGISGQA